MNKLSRNIKSRKRNRRIKTTMSRKRRYRKRLRRRSQHGGFNPAPSTTELAKKIDTKGLKGKTKAVLAAPLLAASGAVEATSRTAKTLVTGTVKGTVKGIDKLASGLKSAGQTVGENVLGMGGKNATTNECVAGRETTATRACYGESGWLTDKEIKESGKKGICLRGKCFNREEIKNKYGSYSTRAEFKRAIIAAIEKNNTPDFTINVNTLTESDFNMLMGDWKVTRGAKNLGAFIGKMAKGSVRKHEKIKKEQLNPVKFKHAQEENELICGDQCLTVLVDKINAYKGAGCWWGGGGKNRTQRKRRKQRTNKKKTLRKRRTNKTKTLKRRRH